MPDFWSPEEDAATVSTYLTMLESELRREPFNKREHNRRLAPLLNGRSAGAIEFKHSNISAVHIEQGFPYIDGYKPRSNFQAFLRSEVDAQLANNPVLVALADRVVSERAIAAEAGRNLDDILVPSPVANRKLGGVYDRPVPSAPPVLGVNYLEREAQNSSLGAAGENFVLDLEHRRLWTSGAKDLAERIEHVSKTRGDGLGYDIMSFDGDGRDRLIEVKTTSFGAMTPFFASKREVSVSEEKQAHFHLYRVFKFRERPKIFVLNGSLRQSCILDPVQYRATVG